MSRTDLARRTLVHRSTIDRLELEDHLPNTLTFAAIARELRVSVDDLLGVKAG